MTPTSGSPTSSLPNNRAIIVQAPDKADLKLPGEAELTAVVDAVEAKKLEPYTDRVAQTKLMDQKPAPAAIVYREDAPRPRRHGDHARQRRARHHETDDFQEG